MADGDETLGTNDRRRVLNAGCGPLSSTSFARGFVASGWEVVRLDINPEALPDVLGSFTDMRDLFEDASFDAIWSSHSLEHLYAHEVQPTLSEFKRILKPTGFALITCPDLEAVASLLVAKGLHHIAYESLAGPISVHDMLFGHGRSIASGDQFMAHKTGFDAASLGAAALDAGFFQAQVGSDDRFGLWAALMMPDADASLLRPCLAGTTAEFLLDSEISLAS